MPIHRPKNYRRFLDPQVISKLDNMSLRARLVVEGFIAGLHKSPYHGFSVEFAQHRQYMPGDALRHIDWKVYGKTDRFYIKQYEEETNLKAYILLDVSASMGYTSGSVKKIEYGSYLASALTYLMLRQQDAVGLLTFDETIKKYIPPKTVKSHLHILLKELEDAKASQVTNIAPTLHQLAERIKRRGLIILISDLFDDHEAVMAGLKHFRHRNHEVVVFHILDDHEIRFPFKKETIFRDMETGEELLTQPWAVRKEYRKKLDFMTNFYQTHCRQQLIDYVLINTSDPFDLALTSYLNKRTKLG